jgi:DNA-binding LacI/PurR family transcriptional regulator
VYRPGEFLASVRKLSDKYDVSDITVRGALDILESQGIVDRHARRGVVVRRTLRREAASRSASGRILFIRWAPRPSLSEHLEGIRRYCTENGVELIFVEAQQSHDKLLSYLRHPGPGVEGVLLFPFDTPEYVSALRDLLARGVQIVSLGRELEGIDVSTAMNDDFTGGYVVTKHLIELRHRPVHSFGWREHPFGARQRYLGWAAAMEQAGFDGLADYFHPIEIPEEVLASRPISEHWSVGQEIMRQILSSGTRENGGWSICAMNDHFARGVYRAAKAEGLRIGREIWVAGNGDQLFARRLHPPLTSVAGAPSELGYAGARLLHKLMIEKPSQPVHELLPVTLVERESSLGPRKARNAARTDAV